MPDGLRLLGLDIGGTSSRARLWADGGVAADVSGASASLPAAGADGARAALSELLDGLRLDPADPVDAICAGSAGLSVPGAREFLLEQLAPLARRGTVTIVSDAMLVLPAADLAAGVAVICGTGSVAVGTDGGRSVQVGGWGYLLGDEGGGYWVVREALRVLLSRRDEGRAPAALASALLSATGAADVAVLQRQFYEQSQYPRHWARLAPLVLASTDPAAADIAARAADAIAALAAAAVRKLDSPAGVSPAHGPAEADSAVRQPAVAGVVCSRHRDRPGGFPVVLAGGLMANAAFADAARRAVRAALADADVRVLATEPVAGAIRLASLAVRGGSVRGGSVQGGPVRGGPVQGDSGSPDSGWPDSGGAGP